MMLAAVAVCVCFLTLVASVPPRPSAGGGGGSALLPLPQQIAALPPVLPLPRLAPSSRLYRTTGMAGVALTFDDGPDPYWTPKVLDLLRRNQVRATFCVLGSLAGRYPHLVRRIVREGHTLCNHTMRHDLRLRKRSPRHIAADLRRANQLIARAGGVTPKLFRAPGGNWSPLVIDLARQQGMAALHWTVDPQDWRRPHPYHLILNVRKNTRPGSIVLLHDAGGDRRNTYAALGVIVPALRKQYSLVPL
jgi:peptidoglycan-N-acetylglucosamine deacetylase